MMNRHAIAAIAIAAVLGGSSAFAMDKVATGVQLADLDLTTAQGMATAKARIEASAKKACSMTNTGSRMNDVDRDCQADLMKKLNASLAAMQAQAVAQASKASGASPALKTVD